MQELHKQALLLCDAIHHEVPEIWVKLVQRLIDLVVHLDKSVKKFKRILK